MTTASETADKAEALKARAAEMAAEEKTLNEGRTGKGTRVFLGMTRGRNPQKIQYEGFDDSQPDTLPTSLSEFVDLTKTQDEKAIVGYLIDGYNSAQYTAASDPISEFIDPTWPEEFQRSFRLVVRNYATNANVSIEDAVALIKPGIAAAAAKAIEKS